ncbi:hypothetical protein M9980_13815 [Sphingomonas donggukensis]|uniref:Spore coat protein U domain-containing protein n=1 Tax=Sphingomonas donggukensis TaxID=2949093 RepID=A0ABY4TT54_9SPHN|nr:hypothetical protein [Sphingomonas donggukensis]URW75581.1 hypothetical protein M9980_13815 [Sphingomonas donggukensis]
MPLAVLVAAGIAALAATPAAACTVRLGPVNAVPIAYDPFVVAAAGGWVRVSVDLVDGDACDTAVVLTDDGASPLRTLTFGPGAAVAFRPRLRPGANVREGTDPAEASVALTAASPHAEIAWYLESTGDGVLPPGDYVQPVKVQVRAPVEGGPPSTGAVALRSVARAQINLAGTAVAYDSGSDAATIELGELRSGSSGRAFLQLRGNTQAHLSFTSQQHGYLASTGASGRIAYAMTFDGRPVDLAAPATIAIDAPPSLRGASFELAVRVPDVTGAVAGRYSDTVVIDVSP